MFSDGSLTTKGSGGAPNPEFTWFIAIPKIGTLLRTEMCGCQQARLSAILTEIGACPSSANP
jgi:hypothetical protein